MARKSDLQRLPSGDMHPAYVKAALTAQGLTLTGLARRHHKHSSYFRVALIERFPKALTLLARAIGQRPHAVWPTLFDEKDSPIKRRRRAVSTARLPTSGHPRSATARA